MNERCRTRLALSLLVLLVLTVFSVGAERSERATIAQQTHDPVAAQRLDFAPFAEALAAITPARERELGERIRSATIPQLRAAIQRADLTAAELTLYSVLQIQRHDERLHSVIALDPTALQQAIAIDRRIREGQTPGVLAGIPVLLKDNIATRGPLPTTAGAAALADTVAPRDAEVVTRLRAAGAIIIGKANMTEWANFISTQMPNGYSAVGGQTRNPYGPFDSGGSSSGSAVAVNAGFVPVAIGSETSGSIVYPAAQNGLYALKPTLGATPTDLVIPITSAQDVLGPMARNPLDAAILYSVMSGEALPNLRENALDGTSFGVVVGMREFGSQDLLSQGLRVLQRGGATIERSRYGRSNPDLLPVLLGGFQREVPRTLQALGAPLTTLDELIAFNNADPDARIPYGQNLLIAANESTLRDQDYRALVQQNRANAQAALDYAFEQQDFLVSISNSLSAEYSAAGYPAVTIPLGLRASGEAQGLTIIGPAGSDLRLLHIAYRFAQVDDLRVNPALE